MSAQYHRELFLPISMDWYKHQPREELSNKRNIQNSAYDLNNWLLTLTLKPGHQTSNNDCTFDIQCHKHFWWEDIKVKTWVGASSNKVLWRPTDFIFSRDPRWWRWIIWKGLAEYHHAQLPAWEEETRPGLTRYTFKQLRASSNIQALYSKSVCFGQGFNKLLSVLLT